jgi:hypothetical protein
MYWELYTDACITKNKIQTVQQANGNKLYIPKQTRHTSVPEGANTGHI